MTNNFLPLLWQFYKAMLWWNLLISAVCFYTISLTGAGNTGNTIIVKITAYGGMYLFQSYFYPNTWYYYRNAGCSLKKLYSWAFISDLFVYLLMVMIYLLALSVLHAKG